MADFHTLDDFDFFGRRVLVRVDFNVPLKGGKVANDKRIRAALPTLKQILKNKPKQLFVMSHLGRPRGEVVPELSTRLLVGRFSELLGEKVFFFDQFSEVKVPDSEVVLLENTRFSQGEKMNGRGFAEKLAALADLFVFDAFGAAHRAHASVVGVMDFLPSCAGLLMQREIEQLSKALYPKHPYVAIIGGAKADKIDVIKNLLEKTDKILIGGVLADTFLKARGVNIQASKYDQDSLELAKQFVNNEKIVLPLDAVAADKFDNSAHTQIVGVDNLPEKNMALDIGPKTIETWKSLLSKARTVVWAGPIGAFELEKFSHGTKAIAEFLAYLDATTIIGGGDTATAIENFGLADKMTHVSTGGGASLEFLSGKELPAVRALKENMEKFSN